MSNLEFSFIARVTADPGSRATTTQYSRKKVLVRAKQPVRFSGERRGFVGTRHPGNVSRILSSIGGRHAIRRAWSTARRVTGRYYDTSEAAIMTTSSATRNKRERRNPQRAHGGA